MWFHVSKACREERWHSADNGCDTVLNGAGVLGEVTNLIVFYIGGGWATQVLKLLAVEVVSVAGHVVMAVRMLRSY